MPVVKHAADDIIRRVSSAKGEQEYDYVIIGAGLVGLATAWALRAKHPTAAIALIEKEASVATHQSGRNSGVLHSGVYYESGSLKADLVKRGRLMLLDFCDEHKIRYELCGKLILATHEHEFAQLDALHQRGIKNGLAVKILDARGIKEIEPHAAGLRALWIPEAGVIDFRSVAKTLFQLLSDHRVQFKLATELVGAMDRGKYLVLETKSGALHAKKAINCAGLFSDRIARRTGIDPGLRIIPFRGEYFQLKPAARSLVRGLVYPLADKRLPFLGVHLTRTINGEVLAGPNAVFALHREGYHPKDMRFGDAADSLAYSGFWRLALRHLDVGFGEMFKAWSASAFTKAARRLVPELSADDFVPAQAGIRAQAVDRKGMMVDDFRFLRNDKWLHVVNAPSPAATACFAIGKMIAGKIERPTSSELPQVQIVD